MLQRLVITVAAIAALSISIGSRAATAAGHRAGMGGAGQLGGAGSAWHGVAGRGLVAGLRAGDGAGPMWDGGSMTRSLVTHTLVTPTPNPLMSYSASEGFAWKRCTA